LTVAGANLAAESGAQSCELHKFHPETIRSQFNRARQDIFPHICNVRDLRTIVTGQSQHTYTLPTTLRGAPIRVYLGNREEASGLAVNLVTDAGFEDWTDSTTPASWTNANHTSITQEQETTSPSNYAVLEGSNSAKCLVPATTACTLLHTITPTVATEGMEVNFSIWVYSVTASRVSAQISGTNVVTTTVNGDTHGGTGWEQLTVTATLNQAATAFNVGVHATSDSATFTYYVDEAVCVVGQTEQVDKGWSTIHDWMWVPSVAGASDGGKIEFPYPLSPKHRIRIIGRDMLSSVSADTSTVEVDGELLSPLYNLTRAYLAEEYAMSGPVGEREFWIARASQYRGTLEVQLNSGYRIQTPNIRAKVPDA
jgi:hypothetical protein